MAGGGDIMKKHFTMLALAEQYLTYRRKLGYSLKIEGAHLLNFANYADAQGHDGHLTTELALRWARLPKKASSLYWARRLEVVRCFARYLAVFVPMTEIPPKGILGTAHCRNTPHIYSMNEVKSLLEACAELTPTDGLRPYTYATLFGLMAATGLRVAESLKLTDSDVDLEKGILTIRQSKFHKSRLVPLHPSVTKALTRYFRIRRDHWPIPICRAFFVSDNGKALPYSTLRYTFHTLCRKLGWDRDSGNRRPRIYDLRHTFATRRLALWQEQGEDNRALIPALSTYMGHAKVSDTYWYLTGVPELFAVPVQAFERYACANEGGSQ